MRSGRRSVNAWPMALASWIGANRRKLGPEQDVRVDKFCEPWLGDQAICIVGPAKQAQRKKLPVPVARAARIDLPETFYGFVDLRGGWIEPRGDQGFVRDQLRIAESQYPRHELFSSPRVAVSKLKAIFGLVDLRVVGPFLPRFRDVCLSP